MPAHPSRHGSQATTWRKGVSGSTPLADDIGVDKICKIPRPLKRRRSVADTLDFAPTPPSKLPAASLPAWSWSGRAATASAGDFELVLAESLAMLSVEDIMCGATVCSAWRDTAECRALWALAAPRLGLAGRVVQRKEISRRRSRGTVLRGVLFGSRREAVALRVVDLEGANAGVDDGLLPSIVRELALLHSINGACHPGVVRFVGAEVSGKQVSIATEYMPSSFAAWFAQPRAPQPRLRAQVRDYFGQLLRALAFLHGRGVLHRNLSPSNVLLDPAAGVVKVCDFAYSRALDTPLRPYSPEDPKLRAQSTREAKRLWYRAPELLLRQPVYGPATDAWSVGTLLAEAACGEPLFASESEIDHLFRIFRFTGSPSPDLWPEAVLLPTFSPRFPVYRPFDLRAAARAARGSIPDTAALAADVEHKPEMKSVALRIGRVLGMEGMDVLVGLLQLEPRKRSTPKDALQFPFMRRQSLAVSIAELHETGATVGVAAVHSSKVGLEAAAPSRQPGAPAASDGGAPADLGLLGEALTPGTAVARRMARIRLTSSPYPPQGCGGYGRGGTHQHGVASASSSSGSSNDVAQCQPWPPLWAEMVDLEAAVKASGAAGRAAGHWAEAPVSADRHAACVNHIVALATRLGIGDFGVHLGVALFCAACAQPGGADAIEPELAATACLKLADAFDEHSQEYYQREKTVAYYHGAGERWSMETILGAEKAVAQKLGFIVHRPTVAWFLRSCVHSGGRALADMPDAVELARYIADLVLLDAGARVYPAALLAQVALLLAVHAAAPGSGSHCVAGRAVPSPIAATQAAWAGIQLATCHANQGELAAACFTQTVHTLCTLRGRWHARGLTAVEQRHPVAARRLVLSSGAFPPELAGLLVAPQDGADGAGAPPAPDGSDVGSSLCRP